MREEDSNALKTLVVEVDFDTDPNAISFRQNVLDAIWDTARDAVQNKTTMDVHHLKVVPKRG
jgi:hypothetical protein